MKAILTSLFGFALLTLISHGQVIDTFSTSDSGNYNNFLEYNGDGNGSGTFATNGAGQFQPESPAGTTNSYFRNTGESLSDTVFGQSVSIDLINVNQLGAAGLALATNLSDSNHAEFALYSPSANQFDLTGVNNGGPSATFGADFSQGSITETLTRTGDTTFAYTLAGPGLTSGTQTGTFTLSAFAGQAAFFAMDIYGGGSDSTDNVPSAASQQIEDYLTFTWASVPEP